MNKYLLAVIAVIGIIAGLAIIKDKANGKSSQFKPCVWPNTCAAKPALAQFQPCVWPNTCASYNG